MTSSRPREIYLVDVARILLRGIKREEIQRGPVFALPGSVNAYKEFEGTITVNSEEEGGVAIDTALGITLFINVIDVSATMALVEGSGSGKIQPGESVKAIIFLKDSVAIEEGQGLRIRGTGKPIRNRD
ncbi:conserved hypothetical protein [Talaromyces stipitatus ATCC 10500]|uniref:Translation elongation factor EFTu-like domain-containing protein n=1 Tax=Talaromyces stipitatus (strain ATCC 10500 / CBS 375.48 / QM 6759 / NRRL 1006) TaxID=441959 RepID=B8MSN2_TALSN|nr:uncharacterized protein TSTA_005070 [Talaromyces stipitatus ATCC 10500]EED12469.1 conserved hypothetical protein [Talaromyces stipitatus ATCC 10500]